MLLFSLRQKIHLILQSVIKKFMKANLLYPSIINITTCNPFSVLHYNNITRVGHWIIPYTDAIPYDGVSNNETLPVDVGITITYTLLTAVGTAFTFVCLCFNIVFRKTK